LTSVFGSGGVPPMRKEAVAVVEPSTTSEVFGQPEEK
jgi:hypothetical protein